MRNQRWATRIAYHAEQVRPGRVIRSEANRSQHEGLRRGDHQTTTLTLLLSLTGSAEARAVWLEVSRLFLSTADRWQSPAQTIHFAWSVPH